MAQFDAYCAPFTKYDVPELKEKALCFEAYPLNSGKYSAQFQTVLGIAEALLDLPITTPKLIKGLHSHQNDRGITEFSGFNSAAELAVNLTPNSTSNNFLMRVIPVGVLPTPEQVLEVAELVVRITNNNSVAIFAGQVAALLNHFALYEKEKLSSAQEYCSHYLPNVKYLFKRCDYKIVNPELELKSIHAVFDLVTTQNSLLDILQEAIFLDGEIKSVAVAAGGIFSARHSQLPKFFDTDFEVDSEFGKQYLQDLGSKLMEKYK